MLFSSCIILTDVTKKEFEEQSKKFESMLNATNKAVQDLENSLDIVQEQVAKGKVKDEIVDPYPMQIQH